MIIKTLDLPRNGLLLEIAKRLEFAMKAGATKDVGGICGEFLATASEFYRVAANVLE